MRRPPRSRNTHSHTLVYHGTVSPVKATFLCQTVLTGEARYDCLLWIRALEEGRRIDRSGGRWHLRNLPELPEPGPGGKAVTFVAADGEEGTTSLERTAQRRMDGSEPIAESAGGRSSTGQLTTDRNADAPGRSGRTSIASVTIEIRLLCSIASSFASRRSSARGRPPLPASQEFRCSGDTREGSLTFHLKVHIV